MIELTVLIFVGLLTMALIISIAAERLRIPAAAALVGVGALIQAGFHLRTPFHFGPTLLYVFLPPLVFEAAWNIDLAALTRNALRISLLAFIGTLATAGSLTLTLGASHALSWPAAFLFGSIIAATDPIAVVGVFRRVNIPSDIKTIIEGESLANDGVAVALFGIALGLATSSNFDASGLHLATITLLPFFELWGGSILGATMALPLYLALRATRSSEYEVAATVALAYLAYLSASHFHLSGIFATAASAITLRGLIAAREGLLHRDDVDIFWNASASLANTVLFFASGLLIDPLTLGLHPGLIVLALLSLIGARALIAYFGARDTKTQAVLFLAGMRGALPLALALALPTTIAARHLIFDGVAAAVILTIVIQGGPLEPVLRWIYRE